MMVRFIVSGALTLAGIAALAGASLWRYSQHSSHAIDEQSGRIKVRRGKLVCSLMVSGEMAPSRGMRITVPRYRDWAAVPIQAMAPEGALVKPGDVLLQIDNTNLIANYNTEQINLEKAENDLIKKQAELESAVKDLEMELATRKLDMEKARLKAEISRELMSLREWQDHQFNHQKAKKEYEKVSQNLDLTRRAAVEDIALLRIKRDQVEAKIKAIKTNLSALQILATTSGTVLYENAPWTWNRNTNDPPRKFQVGDQVYPGMVIMSVPDLSEMEVKVFISEVDGGGLKTGQRAHVVSDSNPGIEFGGTVEYIPEVAERIRQLSNVRVFIGRIKPDRTDPQIMKPGMSVRAEIFTDERSGLLLPRKAVREERGRFFVQHTTRGKTEVRVLARNTADCLIEGLTEGDEVSVSR